MQFVLSWQQDSLPCPKPIPRLTVLITTPGITLHTDEPLNVGCSPCSWTDTAPAMGLWLHQKKGVFLSQFSSGQRNKLYSRHFCSMHIFVMLVKMKRLSFITCLSSAIKKRTFRAGVKRVLVRQLGHTDKGEDCSTKEHSQEQGSGALLWQLPLSFLRAELHVHLSVCKDKDVVPLRQGGKEHLLALITQMVKPHTSSSFSGPAGCARTGQPHF